MDASRRRWMSYAPRSKSQKKVIKILQSIQKRQRSAISALFAVISACCHPWICDNRRPITPSLTPLPLPLIANISETVDRQGDSWQEKTREIRGHARTMPGPGLVFQCRGYSKKGLRNVTQEKKRISFSSVLFLLERRECYPVSVRVIRAVSSTRQL